MNTITPPHRLAVAIVFALSLLLTSCASKKETPEAESTPIVAEETAAVAPVPPPAPPPPPPAIPVHKAVYDLNIMSLCPYGITALSDVTDLLRAFPESELGVWFIGRADGDKLASLRGEPEMLDEKLWLGVKALYPARYLEFLTRRAASAPEPTTEALLKLMGFDVAKIRAWAGEHGDDELREHYSRSDRLAINASPTLFLNYKRYEGRVGGGHLVRAQCRSADPVPQFCKEYPECSSDDDCTKPRKIGKCVTPKEKGVGRAVCEFVDDAAFTLTVLTADEAGVTPTEGPVIQSLVRMLPGAQVRTVKFSSDEGKQLNGQYAPAELPFFHFEKSVDGALRFQQIRPRLDDAPDGYTLKKGSVRPNYFPQREEKPGLIELYADPLNPQIGKVIETLLANENAAKKIVLRPAVAPKEARETGLSAVERVREDEALRWITLANDFPKSYGQYLKNYAETPASSYWFYWLKPAKISPKKFMGRIEANRKSLGGYGEGITEIYQGEPAVIMVGNRAKITPQGEQGLERALKELGL